MGSAKKSLYDLALKVAEVFYEDGYEDGYDDGYEDGKDKYKSAISDGLRNGSSECAKAMRSRRKD